MASIQSGDVKSSFNFIEDLNAHDQQQLGFVSPTNSHGPAALDFSHLSGCQLGSIHSSGNYLKLVLTDLPGIIKISVLVPIGTSDQFPLVLLIIMASTLRSFLTTLCLVLTFPVRSFPDRG